MEYQRVHFIGVGGIGMSALAKLLKLRGVHVSGSDVTDSPIVAEVKHLNIPVWIGSRPDRIGKDVDVVVYSSAVPDTDEELIRARHIGTREVVYNEFLGEVARGYRTIAVTGTHGKSTTTAMIGHVLAEAGLDPTVVVGSKVSSFKHGNLRVGKSDLIVVEACEYMAHMLHIDPDMAVVTNVEFDHPDFYRDLDHVKEVMGQFVDRVKEGGTVVVNAQDEASQGIRTGAQERDLRTLSVGEGGELWASVTSSEGAQTIHVHQADAGLGDVQLLLPGAYNVQNALVALCVALALEVPFDRAARALGTFTGLWRRFEKLGTWQGAQVYTDYAHHPTALLNLLEGARRFFPSKRVVLCFEPHQHARTRGLFDEFVASMDDADVIVLSEVYDVAGRNEVAAGTSSAELVEAIQKRDAARGVDRPVTFAENMDQAIEQLSALVQEGDLLLMTGAGDVDAAARNMVGV